MNHFGQHAVEPVWRARRALFAHPVPPGLAPWLFDPGSLTRRLVARCKGTFRVRMLGQGWARPLLNEATRLGLPPQQVALIREVQLLCEGETWVYARTVIPHSTLRGGQRRLAHLGSRPLGAALFADPRLRREEVEVACMTRRHRLFHTAVQGLSVIPERIWGRRSVFFTGGKPLLVNEVFLPTLVASP